MSHTSQMTDEQKQALKSIAMAIIDTVKKAGSLGAPSGVLYAALMAQGCTLSQYQKIMGGLVNAGYLSLQGDCYHYLKGF